MLIEFSAKELQHLKIAHSLRVEPCQRYLEEREAVWCNAVDLARDRKESLWNGEAYTLENIIHQGDEHVILQVSSCEYKDVIFKQTKGSSYIIHQFEYSHLVKLAGVICVPITLDGKFVAGIRAVQEAKGNPPIDVIGGLLAKNEMEIHNFADIRTFMRKEIAEETSIQYGEQDLSFFRLVFQKNIYHFCFGLRLPVRSEEIERLHKSGEFSALVAMSPSELLESGRTVNPLRYLIPYLRGLQAYIA